MLNMAQSVEKFNEYVQSTTNKGYALAGQIGTFSKSYKQDMNGYNTEEAITNHPLVRACSKIKINAIIKGGWRLTDTPTNSKKAEESFFKARVDKFIPKILWQMAQTNSYYGEIVLDGNKRLRSLNTRDAKFMEHLLDSKGNLRGFVQVIDNELSTTTRDAISRARTSLTSSNKMFTGKDRNAIYYKLEEILYISTDHLDSSTFAHAELLTLANTLYYIDLIEKFIAWLFESNQFRTAIRVPTNMGNPEYKKYLSDLFDSLKSTDRFLLLRGDGIQHQPLREIKGFNELLSLLDYYRSQVLSLMQVTPVQVSLTSDSNRSSSDTQYRYVNYDDIRAKQSVISSSFTYDLFPFIGLQGATLKWNPIDMKEKKEIVELAQMFLGMNANVDKVNNWLINQGLDIPTDFLEEVEINLPLNKEQDSKVLLDKNSTLHNSRKPKNVEFEDMARE